MFSGGAASLTFPSLPLCHAGAAGFLWLCCGRDAAGGLAVKGLSARDLVRKGQKLGWIPTLSLLVTQSACSSLREHCQMERSGSGREGPLLQPALPRQVIHQTHPASWRRNTCYVFSGFHVISEHFKSRELPCPEEEGLIVVQ